MTGKTHMAAGIAASLVVTGPKTPKEMLICITVAAVGAVISDIDVSTSDARREFNRFLGIAGFILLTAFLLEYYFKFGIFRAVRQHGYLEIAIGFGLFLAICLFGKKQPHRSFMHSLLALALLTGSVYLMFPAAAFPFAVAMASHIGLDMLNKRKVKLFYPFRKGIACSMCRADGTVSSTIFYSAFLVDLVIIGWILFNYFRF